MLKNGCCYFRYCLGLILFSVGLTACVTQSPIPTQKSFLFVQTAPSAILTETSLTLTNVRQKTLWFSDRPVRQYGVIDTTAFVSMWVNASTANDFTLDAPNAALVDLSYKTSAMAAIKESVITLSAPHFTRTGDLMYRVKFLSEPLIKKARITDVSLFIDDGLVGMCHDPGAPAGSPCV